MKKITNLLAVLLLALTMIMTSACGAGAGDGDNGDNGASSGTKATATESADAGGASGERVSKDPNEEFDPEFDYDLDHQFKNHWRLDEHFEKHGEKMGFDSPEEYEWAADQVIHDPDALHKIEMEDGDDIYYLLETNEFVVVSPNGVIRTYFSPDSGVKYFNKQ